MTIPFWALSLAYWLHMLATVVWIGSLAALGLFMLPAARQSLPSVQYADLLGQIQRRMDPIGWFSMVLLVGTGMLQMSVNPNYEGFLAIDSRWAAAILIKHIVFVGMVALSAYVTWVVLPDLRRLALRQARTPGVADDDPSQQSLLKKEALLIRLNLLLGILVLALTAVARAS